MKKFIILSIFILLCIPAYSFATSGACSSHGGVNMSAGADYDGSVICYDGWRDSSVQYSDMSGAVNESQCAYLLGQMYRNGSMQGDAYANSTIQHCYDQVNQVNTSRSVYDPNASLIAFCKKVHGPNSQYDGRGCSCLPDNFLNGDGQCVLRSQENLTLSCKYQFGDFSIMTPGDANSCSCMTGYQFNFDKQCVAIVQDTEVNQPKQPEVAPVISIPTPKKVTPIKKEVKKEVVKEESTVVKQEPVVVPAPVVVSTPEPTPPVKFSGWKRFWSKFKFW